MQTVSIGELKNNPPVALKHARDEKMVVVTDQKLPEANLVELAQLGMPDLGRLRLAIAASLFRDGVIGSGAAARMAGESRGDMLDPLARLGIPLLPEVNDIADDVDAIDASLARSCRR